MADLVIQNISVYFSGVVALDDVSLTVPSGSIYSLVGANGSGKTTFFNCVNGFVKPRRGNIFFNDSNLLDRSPHEIIHAGISRTFQNLENIPYMTVLENVLLGNHTRISAEGTFQRWVSRKQREKEESDALKMLSFLGLANYEQKYLTGQPYAIQKLVEIARALVCRPQLIMIDEPAAGMNDQESMEMAKIITEIRDELGITVLLVEHDMNLVMGVSDRICVLDSGRVLAEGTPDEIKTHPEVVKAFIGEGADA